MSDSAKELAKMAWFVARGADGAGQFPVEQWLGPKCLEEFEAWWSDPHRYYREQKSS